MMDYIFSQLPWTDIVVFFSAILFALGMVICFLIMPLICHFYIMPRIEKKIGKKLGYNPVFDLTPGTRYAGRCIEISKYILYIYRAKKKYGATGLPDGHGGYLLKHAGYTIDMVSRRELIFSYVYQISNKVTMVAFLIGGAIACYQSYILKQF